MKKQLLILLCLVLGVFTQTWAQGNNPYVLHIYSGRAIYGFQADELAAAMTMAKDQLQLETFNNVLGPQPRYYHNGKALFYGAMPGIFDLPYLPQIMLYSTTTVADNFGFSFTDEDMQGLMGTALAGYTGIVVDFSKDNIAINSDNFPDEKFREYLQRRSYGKDYVLTQDEINDVTKLSVTYEDITSLTGIEYFTALTRLDCSGNQLTSLDVSKNTALEHLECYYNQLTSLDVSKNTALTWLDCHDSQLTTLDVSNNTALTRLDCYTNQLTTLDVSKNTALTHLHCDRNELTSLDLSNNTALTRLACYTNQLTSLVVSPNALLDEIYCEFNQMKGEAVDAFINSLPNGGGDIFFIDFTEDEEGNEITDKQVAAAKTKGWRIYAWGGYGYGWYYYDGISTGINQPELAQPGAQRTYTIDGRRVEGTQKNPGIYVRGGKKVMVK